MPRQVFKPDGQPPEVTTGVSSPSNGLANTNTLVSLGTASYPAANYCKTLTTGGYNTWYLPAINELMTLYSNKSRTPFATLAPLLGMYHWSSTEADGAMSGKYAKVINIASGSTYAYGGAKQNGTRQARAVRRSTI